MIIRLDTWDGANALTVVRVLKENGINGVLTMNGKEDQPYEVAFDTDDIMTEDEEVCMGDCSTCIFCDETCEDWEACEHGAVMHSESKAEEEDNKIVGKIYVADIEELLSDLLDSAKTKSRILNE